MSPAPTDPSTRWPDAEALSRARAALAVLHADADRQLRPSPAGWPCHHCEATRSRQWHRGRGLPINYWRRVYLCERCWRDLCESRRSEGRADVEAT